MLYYFTKKLNTITSKSLNFNYQNLKNGTVLKCLLMDFFGSPNLFIDREIPKEYEKYLDFKFNDHYEYIPKFDLILIAKKYQTERIKYWANEHNYESNDLYLFISHTKESLLNLKLEL